jgi:CheY-like chemotaxis protein
MSLELTGQDRVAFLLPNGVELAISILAAAKAGLIAVPLSPTFAPPQVEYIPTGVEAVARYRELAPDLVTLDIVMPEMDGVEALRTIRGADPQARIVMVSAVDQRAKLAECIQLGAHDFIVKPFDREALGRFFASLVR